jgi:hypothetical protein
MKTKAELNYDILKITNDIANTFPELSKYIEEMPVKISYTQRIGIDHVNYWTILYRWIHFLSVTVHLIMLQRDHRSDWRKSRRKQKNNYFLNTYRHSLCSRRATILFTITAFNGFSRFER